MTKKEIGYNILKSNPNISTADLALAINGNRRYARQLREKFQGFETDEIPSEILPAEDLVRQKKERFVQREAAAGAKKLRSIRITIPGPIGICHMDDPHIDDDGTDICRIEHDLKLIRDTEGMFGANVGDVHNNWAGRLARLYGEQSTSSREAWELVKWYLGYIPWLYVVGGNHDCWDGKDILLDWIIGQNGNFGPSYVRMSLAFANGREVRVNARHKFPGTSIYNPAHGPMRAALFGWRDHILTCGHLHKTGYGLLKCPVTGMISHALQIATYKIYDQYAIELGLPDQNISPNCTTVIDPEATNDVNLVTIFWDLETAADFLTYLRRRK